MFWQGFLKAASAGHIAYLKRIGAFGAKGSSKSSLGRSMASSARKKGYSPGELSEYTKQQLERTELGQKGAKHITRIR